MLDKKKLNNASIVYARKTWNHDEHQYFCMDGFYEGAIWAINEFLKDLWHPASEEPKVGLFAPCVVQLQSDYEGCRFAVYDYHKSCGFSSPKEWIDKKEIIRWAYVSDLFLKQVEPKK